MLKKWKFFSESCRTSHRNSHLVPFCCMWVISFMATIKQTRHTTALRQSNLKSIKSSVTGIIVRWQTELCTFEEFKIKRKYAKLKKNCFCVPNKGQTVAKVFLTKASFYYLPKSFQPRFYGKYFFETIQKQSLQRKVRHDVILSHKSTIVGKEMSRESSV